ncbi:hypothetical protein NHX12_020793 [Muraenolepis orangiensis]|uniref:Inter-alpha-trypsin inhibitor heavy chain 2 n=1 Tax=Muraenolepis orangiensis TaxID=630683 RepID=A0A9Q0EU72_9TELE|nr:hypothetical protein NHX12_020793 [Muraenolepis orangiensis]
MRSLGALVLLVLVQWSRGFEFVVEGDRVGDAGHRERHKRAFLTSEEEDFEAIRGDDITVKSYKVESRITSRFAHTTVRSSVVNSGSKSQSIGFNVQIPKKAFITNFTMNVNGIIFKGSVKEKSVARNLYSQARAKGKAAGIVRTNSQDMETFKTEVHVPPGSHIEFELHYQEMMTRKLGFYEHSLHLQPGRLVPQFQVDVHIYEPRGISFVETSNALGERFHGVTKVNSTKDKAHIVFKPTLQQQQKCDNCTASGVDGRFTVTYDVEREGVAGELQVSDGHFVQFFAPTNLPPLPKNIVFVIDVSGSMWGVKMKQTVEAMQTILDDLTIDDYFSVIDFNHNVRCWSDDLVPGSSIQVAAAKKYIQGIKPNGGTNINEALLRAVQMLLKASNQRLIDPRSVSMIILVSDGDPTVGEIKLHIIQKNVKRVMKEEFSLFSLGIGFDVDYDFLERIATENRGMAQRVYSNHAASEQLRKFYSQVSTPLLRQISIQFPEDTVSNVTYSRFDKFFSGSELVVAGKVLNTQDTTLTSFTTASGASLDLTLQTDTEIGELDAKLALQQHSFTGFARQMWAYITVNQLITERSLAPTAIQKRRITQRIMRLAVEHQFVTPLTALLVESEDGAERLLTLVYSKPPWAPTQVPPKDAKRPPPVIWVDSDPHFIVHLPRNKMEVCFNIDSRPGHILNLVSDPGTGTLGPGPHRYPRARSWSPQVPLSQVLVPTGLAVNGRLVGAKRPRADGKTSTYFGAISVFSEPDGVSVTVDTERIVVSEGGWGYNITWSASANITLHGRKHPVNVDFLGIYIPTDNRYSPRVHGLIGQFSTEPEVKVHHIHQGADPLKPEATMEVKGNQLSVTRGWQKDYRQDRNEGSDVFCWFIHNSGKGFIDGHYTSYIVPHLHSFLLWA